MRVSVSGQGYVGLVTAACLAELGHEITGVDIDPVRIARLRQGDVPFHEPGLAELVETHLTDGRLRFSDDPTGVADVAVAFVAVGTHDGNGGWQTRTIRDTLRDLVPVLADDAVLVIRSTMPPDFVRHLPIIVRDLRASSGRPPLALAVNPEFTRESTAVRDFLEPDRVVVGIADDPEGHAETRLREIYEPLGAPILVMSAADAALTKLSANLFLATKISFANEVALLCERFGADIERVVEGIGHDKRIGQAFLRPGLGFGGSCLPNQVAMTVRTAERAGLGVPILSAVERVNGDQRREFVDRLDLLANGLSGRRVALLGLTFKPGTDDLRDAPSLDVAARLIAAGAEVVAYDPMPRARDRAAELVPGLQVVDTAIEALTGADVAGLVTEWPEFAGLDWEACAAVMGSPRLVDGRNMCSPTRMRALGFEYLDFGRSSEDRSHRDTAAVSLPAAASVA